MKSLAESILSSTGSGKNIKIDVEYLLTHGFEPDTRSPRTMFQHKETGYALTKHGDKIVLHIFKDYSSLSTKKLVVSTIEDLDLVIEWLKAWKYKSKAEEAELRKKLFKKLKEI